VDTPAAVEVREDVAVGSTHVGLRGAKGSDGVVGEDSGAQGCVSQGKE
jgi:hypothetical protein